MSNNFVGFLKHGGNYLISSLATGALAFISIPIYTRLLNTEDYGIVSIFIGLVSIMASLMALSADRSVSRYYFDQKNELDFKRFVGTSATLSLVFFFINAFILFLFAEEFGNLVGLRKEVVYLIIPISGINIIGLTFEQIYGPLKKSREVAISSVVKVFLGFVFSIALIYLFKKDKFYGQILGQILAGLFIVFFWIRLIKPFFKWSFDVSYIKYIFTYSVPLIPYALSGVIIEQFGKIAIGSSQNISHAGFYSLALTIGSIVNIIIGVTHQAWNPYYFEYMNSKNYNQLDKDFIKIFKLTILVAFGVACFGKEIGLLLAKKEFSESLYLVPIFTVGYIFSQLSFAYIRNFGYTKKTQYMSITILVSGISNVLLNVLLIKSFGEIGAAISFVLSYIIMTILAWFINAYFVKLHSTSWKSLLMPLLAVLPFYIFLYFIFHFDAFLLGLIIKGLLVVFLSIILFWTERNSILLLLSKIKANINQKK
ncbi:lipopolysaccharide biosynthesis protein [Flavobacterium panacagri]|uniref:lipopolysaccharide biosynthesis protein n=1 Tax=Flavobacterium panacagri TaxID=3034146 RepID=UPI0025A6827F|nr:oligosaccharide flippase family protein [Flavobacterium panacagri]